jgi:hypothetical protein
MRSSQPSKRVCPDRLHHYEVRLIDGTIREGDAEGCWAAGTNLEPWPRS